MKTCFLESTERYLTFFLLCFEYEQDWNLDGWEQRHRQTSEKSPTEKKERFRLDCPNKLLIVSSELYIELLSLVFFLSSCVLFCFAHQSRFHVLIKELWGGEGAKMTKSHCTEEIYSLETSYIQVVDYDEWMKVFCRNQKSLKVSGNGSKIRYTTRILYSRGNSSSNHDLGLSQECQDSSVSKLVSLAQKFDLIFLFLSFLSVFFEKILFLGEKRKSHK